MAKHPTEEDEGRRIEYDPDFQGPLKNRSCTDVICLFLFLAFVVAWAVVGVWAIVNGDPDKLLVPRDSLGLRCGLDSEVADRKYLFFFDLTKCLDPSTPFLGCQTTQVCVRQCPNATFYKESSSNKNDATPYCRYEVQDSGKYNEHDCPDWFLPSESFAKRCIPSLASIKDGDLHNQTSLSDLKKVTSNIKLLAEFEKLAEQVISDIISAWWKILIGAGLALLTCLIYILMLRWIAGVMVWISIGGAVAALGAATYFSYHAWQSWKSTYGKDELSSSKTKQDVFLGIFIIVAMILVIVLLMLVFLRKRIVLAIALIKEGSRAVSSVTSVLFFPVVPWLLQLGVVAYAICVGVFLATTGEPVYQYRNVTGDCKSISEGDRCTPNETIDAGNSACKNVTCKFAGIANEAFYPYFQFLNIFGFFWLVFFVSALGQMVLAQVFAQWYWTMKKRTLPFFALTAAFYRTVRYHLGTLAFGSLLIAICRMIRVCLEYVDRKLKQYDNEFTKAIMCCLKCFFWCLEKFLKFINQNAYIMCAIHGKNFCASAKDAFMLLMRNIVRVFVLDKVTDFLFFLSKLLVSLGVGGVAYLFFATDLVPFMDNSRLNYGEVPVVIIVIATYLIATLFFNVYSMAVDTLFLCFLEDCERNDGKTRPYYMSRNLMKILGKKNKPQKYD